MTKTELQPDWCMGIPQQGPSKACAQVHQTLFIVRGGVWGQNTVKHTT